MFSVEKDKTLLTFAISNRIEATCTITFPNKKTDKVNCCFDTGATMTIIPQRLWRSFIDTSTINAIAINKKPIEFKRVNGAFKGYHVNLALNIEGKLQNEPPHVLNDCEVILALDDNAVLEKKLSAKIPMMLIGMRGGPLECGGLCIDWKNKTAHLVQVN